MGEDGGLNGEGRRAEGAGRMAVGRVKWRTGECNKVLRTGEAHMQRSLRAELHLTKLLSETGVGQVVCGVADVAEARVNRKEALQAIKALRRSPRIPKSLAASPALENLFRAAMQLGSSSGPVTLLVPADMGYVQSRLNNQVFTLQQMNSIRKYHLVSGLLKVADLQAMARGSTLATVEGSTIKKITPPSLPVVLLKGRDALPSMVVGGDVYVGDTLAVHIVSTMLIPSDV
ncbi:unnamed protein product [Closterium sp. Yama58-4]|nr:unnamed protein product [Closterium sp. Yama58-4]